MVGSIKSTGNYSSLALSGASRLPADQRSEIHRVARPRLSKAAELLGHAAGQWQHPRQPSLQELQRAGWQRSSYLDNWTQLKTEWTPTDWFSAEKRRLPARERTATGAMSRDTRIRSGHANDRQARRQRYRDPSRHRSRSATGWTRRFAPILRCGRKNELVVGFDVNHINFLSPTIRTTPSLEPVRRPLQPRARLVTLTRRSIGPRTEYDARLDQYSLFAEDRLTLSKELSLIAGIRLDQPSAGSLHDLLTRKL